MLSSRRSRRFIPGPRQPVRESITSVNPGRTAEDVAAYQAKRQAPIAARLGEAESLGIGDISKQLARTVLKPVLIKLGAATAAALFAAGGSAITAPYIHDTFNAKAQADVVQFKRRFLEMDGPIVVPEAVRTHAAATLAVKSEAGMGTGTRLSRDTILYPSALTPVQLDCGSVTLVSGSGQAMSNETVRLGLKGIASTDERPGSSSLVDTTVPVLDSEQIPDNGEIVYVVTQPVDDAGMAMPQIYPAKMAGRTSPSQYGVVLFGQSTGSVTRAVPGEVFDLDELQGGAIIDAHGDFLGMVTQSQPTTVGALSFATSHEITPGAEDRSVYVASVLPVSAATLAEMRQVPTENILPAC